ncbi:NAD-dependent epimerase/dehydratase family protein [Gammaproteobacteria bacterium]|nr:NAD-dependent epimerase/dehydratase family protein [Gammaproteobacteria bacterium]
MKVLILGGDGYLGWPTAMHLCAAGHEVLAIDNYYRREIADKTDSKPLENNPLLPERCEIFKACGGGEIWSRIGDLNSFEFMNNVVSGFQPDTIVHYAEQPSAPYSMMGPSEARETFHNNLTVTFNCILAMAEYCPNAHLIKLGTMGEYGTPNIDIEEGWIDITHNGRSDTFLFPRAASSLYHTTKVLDTDLLWFYVRARGLRVTDLMQGPVYGVDTEQTMIDRRLRPNFHYDDIFGTVVNRFLVQAVADVPLTVYGAGGQTRGYLNLKDTLKCVELACENPAKSGELKIFNQLTETFSVSELAEKIKVVGNSIGLNVQVQNISNPRKEMEEHYYNPKYSGLKELGLNPTLMTNEILQEMLAFISDRKDLIRQRRILPRVAWNRK